MKQPLLTSFTCPAKEERQLASKVGANRTSLGRQPQMLLALFPQLVGSRWLVQRKYLKKRRRLQLNQGGKESVRCGGRCRIGKCALDGNLKLEQFCTIFVCYLQRNDQQERESMKMKNFPYLDLINQRSY